MMHQGYMAEAIESRRLAATLGLPGQWVCMTTQPSPLLLSGGSVFNHETRSFDANVDVLCEEGKISRIAPDQAPDEVSTIDCVGLYLLPGLIDCHVHLTSSGAPDAMTAAKDTPPAHRAWQSAEHARRTLEAGFTTVRDLGAAERLNIDMARAVESGLIIGPRILAAGLGVTMTGGHGHGFIAREADGPDEVRKAVREQLGAGATAIKLFASGGVMTPGVDPQSPSLTEDELRAGVEEAHKAFRIVGSHAQSTEGIKNAIRAGVDSIEHGVWLDEEAIELMCEQGTYMVATLTAPHHIAHGGVEAGIPAYMAEKGSQVLEDHIASFRAAVHAGVRMAMGTDQGTPLNHPGQNAQEIVRIANNGLGPAAAILASTAWAADLLGLEDACGRLTEGLEADIVILNRDPLEDVTILTQPGCIERVIQSGIVVDRQTLNTKAGVNS